MQPPAKKKKKKKAGERGKWGRGESPTKFFFKKRGLTGSQFLGRGVAGKERGCRFYIKNKLKSEIFNYKKVYI